MFQTVKNLPQGLILLSAFFYLASHLFFKIPTAQKRSDYLTPPAIIKNLTFGLNIQYADSFWIRAIQDFDYCDQKVNETDCQGKSWLFEVLDLVTELDTQFYEAYIYGGLSLTVLVNDYAGASQIFDKGVKKFPKDWQLNYTAGYHSMVEEKNFVKAAQRYAAAADYGAPNWVRLLAGRMSVDGGDAEFAIQILEKMIAINEEPKLIERLKNKLKELQKK